MAFAIRAATRVRSSLSARSANSRALRRLSGDGKGLTSTRSIRSKASAIYIGTRPPSASSSSKPSKRSLASMYFPFFSRLTASASLGLCSCVSSSDKAPLAVVVRITMSIQRTQRHGSNACGPQGVFSVALRIAESVQTVVGCDNPQMMRTAESSRHGLGQESGPCEATLPLPDPPAADGSARRFLSEVLIEPIHVFLLTDDRFDEPQSGPAAVEIMLRSLRLVVIVPS